jgi:hypothetical protein
LPVDFERHSVVHPAAFDDGAAMRSSAVPLGVGVERDAHQIRLSVANLAECRRYNVQMYTTTPVDA